MLHYSRAPACQTTELKRPARSFSVHLQSIKLSQCVHLSGPGLGTPGLHSAGRNFPAENWECQRIHDSTQLATTLSVVVVVLAAETQRRGIGSFRDSGSTSDGPRIEDSLTLRFPLPATACKNAISQLPQLSPYGHGFRRQHRHFVLEP